MSTTEQRLSASRDVLKASARRATTLAKAERALADEQHKVAHDLEVLADKLVDQVAAVETELNAAEKSPAAG